MRDKDEILNEMLGDVPDEYDKRPGSFMYDALAPAAIQFAMADEAIDQVKAKLSIENLSGDELAQRIRERTGITRRPATRSIGFVLVAGNGTIQTGDLFETQGGIQFQATETKTISGSGSVTVIAVVPGASGNVPAESITLFPVTLPGITDVTNPEPTHDGFEAESDEDLLQRYYDRIQMPSTSGNRAQYIHWSKEVAGVGDARVVPLWDGPNTVKVIIIDSDRSPASTELVEAVQDHLDPGSTGLGEGVAPIGAIVTVESADGVEIDVEVDVVAESGYTEPQISENITLNLRDYFRSIAFRDPIVSFAKIGAAILAAEGVADYDNLKVNGNTTNIPIESDEVAVLGDLTLTIQAG